MRKARLVRVLVSYSQTNFFIDAGRPRGLECELFLQYEKFLNARVSKRALATHVVFVPVPFEQLLPSLLEGKGDVAAAGLTVTPERLKQVDFAAPYLTGVDEIIVASKAAKPLRTLDDLAGLQIHVAQASSYAQHLRQLNQSLVQRGKRPAAIRHRGGSLETEGLLEMVNAGVFHLTVADRHIAKLWASVLKDIVLRHDLKIHTGSRIAWAVRKNNPKLKASLSAFAKKNKKGTLIGNILFRRYYQNTKWIRNPLSKAERAKLNRLASLFKKYGKRYGFDWLLLAAQAYQESGLNPNARSRAGAVGIMQLLPSTAKDMGIADVRNVESNIHAGVKYMAYLRKRFFNEKAVSPAAKRDFSLAAYNAGPNRVGRWRRKAATRRLDPNHWFHHVERIALAEVGQETVRYVGNINKYYLAYRLAFDIVRRGERKR
jgi:membrane-bound lytic murein transglycosylase MltF